MNIKEVLENNPELKPDLFIRGFLITDKQLATDAFPFYSNWITEKHGKYYFMAHFLTGMHIIEKHGSIFFLMGHAYDPFAMEWKEENILSRIADVAGTEEYFERINDLTGVFVFGDVINGVIRYLVDPSGMQSA